MRSSEWQTELLRQWTIRETVTDRNVLLSAAVLSGCTHCQTAQTRKVRTADNADNEKKCTLFVVWIRAYPRSPRLKNVFPYDVGCS
jgi:hypothetical protein